MQNESSMTPHQNALRTRPSIGSMVPATSDVEISAPREFVVGQIQAGIDEGLTP